MVTQLKERTKSGYPHTKLDATAQREGEPVPNVAPAVLRGLRFAMLTVLWLLGVTLLLGALFVVDLKPASEAGDSPRLWGPFRP